MTKRDTYEELWNKGWRSSNRQHGPSFRTRRRLLLSCFSSVYKQGARILDAGCGNGDLLSAIKGLFNNVGQLTGTDISSSALDIAQASIPDGQFVRWDLEAEALPLSGKYDLITCSEVLEHISQCDIAIKHLRDALEDGGVLIVSVPHSMKYWSQHDEAVFHVRRFEKNELCELLQSEGFEVEQAFTWGCFIYILYYKYLLGNVKPKTTMTDPSLLVRVAQRILYRLFFIDDLLKDVGSGRMLFVVARKQAD